MNDTTFRDDCGTDEPLSELNQSTNFEPKVSISLLGMRIYRSIRVLPLPLDSIGRKLYGCPEDVDWRSVKPYLSMEDYNNPTSDDEDY